MALPYKIAFDGILCLDKIQNSTIEEKVSLLEVQVANLDEDVDFLFDEQVIQDERLLNLEETSLGIIGELDLIEDELEGEKMCYKYSDNGDTFFTIYIIIPGLQGTTLALDFRVTALEENGGGDGNSSVAEIEVRVEALEGTAVDHEMRLTTAETDIEGMRKEKKDKLGCFKCLVNKFLSCNFHYFLLALETTTTDQEARLSAAEENIQGAILLVLLRLKMF